MTSSFECVTSPSSSTILLSRLFYSYGYDPSLDKTLRVEFKDVIESNPSSVIPDLVFKVTTYDLIEGAYSAVDSGELVIPNFNEAGKLSDLSVDFDKSVSNFYPATVSVTFSVSHQILSGSADVLIGLSDDFELA